MRHGAKALPTNLDPTLLEETKQLGLIKDYRVEDMEKLSFPDKSFDFVCCKDSLHHCLAPWQALYEMMRVARKGVFLIEPFDHGFLSSAIYGTRSKPFHWFEEEPGNYAYVNLGALLLRDLPGSAFRRALSDAGFAVTDLPLNPHTRRAVLQSLDILYSRS